MSNKHNDGISENSIEFIEKLKQRWVATVDAMIDPLMIVDQEYQIIKTNKAMANLSGKDVKELIGLKCYTVFADRDKPCEECKMQQSIESRKVENYELVNPKKDTFHEAISQPMFTAEGELEGILQIYRDRTKAKRLEAKLLQKEKLASIGLLAGGIAHEINNPLGGILIFSQILLREMDKESPHYQDVVEIEAATQRCKIIVESLLDFARQGKAPGRVDNFELIDIHDALKSALEFSKLGRIDENVNLTKELTNEKVIIKGDKNKVIQIFLNLLKNGFQAMPDGGTITIRSKIAVANDSSKFVTVEFEDTGDGIDQNKIKKIFDPFYTTKEPNEGTGLGLSICLGIAHEMGGNIDVRSQKNAGSSFTVTFPLAEDTAL